MGAKTIHVRDREVMMPPGFLMAFTTALPLAAEGGGVMSIIIRRPYAFLEKELCSVFKGQEDVKVIVDRRYAERRTKAQPVKLERRRADRRRPKQELLEVALSP
jgi:hypothetical protein